MDALERAQGQMVTVHAAELERTRVAAVEAAAKRPPERGMWIGVGTAIVLAAGALAAALL
jgi:hypothetical protein